jgi:hypothetical protein
LSNYTVALFLWYETGVRLYDNLTDAKRQEKKSMKVKRKICKVDRLKIWETGLRKKKNTLEYSLNTHCWLGKFLEMCDCSCQKNIPVCVESLS